MKEVRMTLAVVGVLNALVADPQRPRYGYDLMGELGFSSGKLYKILARLEAAGWLAVTEPHELERSGGPARVSYLLTSEGLTAARLELARVSMTLGSGKNSIQQRRPGWLAGRLVADGVSMPNSHRQSRG